MDARTQPHKIAFVKIGSLCGRGCLDIPQNSPNLEYKSHLAKNVIIYCRPEFPPLGGAVIKESAFWLITPIYFVAHSKTLY